MPPPRWCGGGVRQAVRAWQRARSGRTPPNDAPTSPRQLVRPCQPQLPRHLPHRLDHELHVLLQLHPQPLRGVGDLVAIDARGEAAIFELLLIRLLWSGTVPSYCWKLPLVLEAKSESGRETGEWDKPYSCLGPTCYLQVGPLQRVIAACPTGISWDRFIPAFRRPRSRTRCASCGQSKAASTLP